MSNILNQLSQELQMLKEENLYLKDKIINHEEHKVLISDFANGCFKNIEFMQIEFEKSLERLNTIDYETLEKEIKALIVLLERMSLIFSIQKKTFLWKRRGR